MTDVSMANINMMAIIMYARKALVWLALKSIRFYQYAVSPYFQPCCRYVPSCSTYAYEAVQKYGICRGAYLALRRVLRCHPLHHGGYDPLP